MTETKRFSQLIITRILRDKHVTLTQLENRATERGVVLSDLYAALQEVHKDKRIKRGVKGGEVYYEPNVARTPNPNPHLDWLRDHYPPMNETNDGSGLPGDYSYLFLRSQEERDEYRARINGRWQPRKAKYKQKY